MAFISKHVCVKDKNLPFDEKEGEVLYLTLNYFSNQDYLGASSY